MLSYEPILARHAKECRILIIGMIPMPRFGCANYVFNAITSLQVIIGLFKYFNYYSTLSKLKNLYLLILFKKYMLPLATIESTRSQASSI